MFFNIDKKYYSNEECRWCDDAITRKYCNYRIGETVIHKSSLCGEWICRVDVICNQYDGTKWIELHRVMSKETFVEAFHTWIAPKTEE